MSASSSTSSKPFQLMALPWPTDSLSPFLSANAIQLHYDLHHKGYVNKMNNFAQQYPELQSLTLAEIVQRYTGKIQDNAAQVLNHNFFWKNLSPNGGNPSARTFEMINQQFKSFDNLVLEFTQKAVDHFGSGWVWLIYDPTTTFLQVVDGHDAYNPIVDGYIPLLALDVWEHAYYPDYINDKKSYAERFWNFINWTYLDQIIDEQITGENYRVYT